MSHEIESFAFNRAEQPWHGLGVPVGNDLSPAEMCRAASLDWQVEMRPLFTESLVRGDDGVYSSERTYIKNRRAVTRTSDGKVYGIAGNNWKPVQNERAFEFFKKFTDAGHATLETAGSLHEGRLVFGLAKLGADFKLPGDDVVKGYLLLVSPHEPGKALVARVTPIRVVCQNTLTLALSKAAKFESRFSHVREFDPAVAAETFGQAREQVRVFERNAHVLKQLNMSTDDVIRVLAPIFQPVKKETDVPAEAIVADKSKMNKPMQALMRDYTEAPGADPGNAWGTLAAGTRYLDHTYNLKKNGDSMRDRSQRLFHSWLAVGAQQKRDLMESLLKMTGTDYDAEGLGLVAAE